MRSITRLVVDSTLVALLIAGGACEFSEIGERGQASQAALAQQAKITQDQARAAAVAAVPGTVQAVRLDPEGNKVVYEVTVQPQTGGTATDVEIDADTGSVLRTEPARAREEDDDD